MTVSRALRGIGRISSSTRARVISRAAELGYRANPLAKSLAGQRKRNDSTKAGGLNLALVRFHDHGDQHWFPSRRTTEAERGHFVNEFITENYPSLAALKRTWTAQGIDGVLIDSHRRPRNLVAHQLIQETDWTSFAVVKLGNGLTSLAANRVRSSVFTQVMTTYENVLAAGYDRVAFISHGSTSEIDDQMRLGAVLAAEAGAPARGVAVTHWIIEDNQPSWESLFTQEIQDKLKKLMTSFKPDAVIGFGPIIYHWLRHSSCDIPRDFGYATPVARPNDINHVAGTLDDIVGGEFVAALQMMETMLARGERGLPSLVQEHTVPVQWIPGPSLPTRGKAVPRPA